MKQDEISRIEPHFILLQQMEKYADRMEPEASTAIKYASSLINQA